MFTSDEWAKNKLSKETKGRETTKIVIMPSFWNHVKYILKIMGPLTRVLRLVDREKKPPMVYIYETILKAKECIMKIFLNDESKLVPSQVQQKILEEQALYKVGYGLFGSDFAKSQRKKISPAFWWRTYEHEAPDMRDLAINKILNLTCSASGCERN
ncbi:hypothetical protein S83_060108 [Arachis hypogaea]